MKIFNKYSKYYDLMYHNKDYQKEADYIIALHKKIPQNILDIGCGTGNHLVHFFKKKIETTGVDLSKQMIKLAIKKYPKINFYSKNAKTFFFKEKFDVITSLFHVISYINTDRELLEIFKNVKKHLSEEGTFIFDFWYNEAVKKDKPHMRTKKFSILDKNFIKISEPVFNKTLEKIKLNLYLIEKNKKLNTLFFEKHLMRSYNPSSLFKLLKKAGFKNFTAYEWLSSKKVNINNWNACIVVKNEKKK